MNEKLLGNLYTAVLEGQADRTEVLTRQGLDAGFEPLTLIDDAMIPAMTEAGRLFETDEYFVPELLIAGRAIQAGLEIVRPLLAGGALHHAGRIVIGTVQGDLHDIGKNLVAIMLEGAGFEVIDLGPDVGPGEFVAAIEEHRPQLVGMSSLLTTTMLAMPTIIEAIDSAGLRGEVKVLVGGAPLTEEWAKEFGADAFADNANAAARTALELVAAR